MDAFYKIIKDNNPLIMLIAAIILFLYLYVTKTGDTETILIDGETGKQFEGFNDCSNGCEPYKKEFKIIKTYQVTDYVRKIGSVRCCRTIRYVVDGVLKEKEKCRDFSDNMCPTNWYLD